MKHAFLILILNLFSMMAAAEKPNDNDIQETTGAQNLNITEDSSNGVTPQSAAEAEFQKMANEINITPSSGSSAETSPQDDLKKIEEEFDLGESASEDPNASSENPPASPPVATPVATPEILPQKSEDLFSEEGNADLEKVLSANYYDKATVLVTNKITAKSQLLTIKVGSSAFFGNIEIFPLKCWKSPNKYNLESKAYVNVIERKIDDESKKIFQGWLFSASIALSTIEHPVYEISIVECAGTKK